MISFDLLCVHLIIKKRTEEKKLKSVKTNTLVMTDLVHTRREYHLISYPLYNYSVHIDDILIIKEREREKISIVKKIISHMITSCYYHDYQYYLFYYLYYIDYVLQMKIAHPHHLMYEKIVMQYYIVMRLYYDKDEQSSMLIPMED